jgi:N-acetylglucosamine-6-sulfatase
MRFGFGHFSRLLVLTVLTTATAGRAIAATSPHIVVVMTDDLDVGIAENMLSLGFLPNIKANVVDRGVRFRSSFVTNSVCCPSRTTYLTGRYSHNHGVLRNNSPRGSVNSFVDTSTLATWLHAAGYRTAHVGKYLNGYGANTSALGTSPQNPAYIPPGWDEWHALVGSTAYQVYGYTMNDNGVVTTHGTALTEYQTAVLSDAAARVVTNALAAADRPLFLTVTPITPHVEMWTVALSLLDGISYPAIWTWFIRPDPRDQTRKPAAWKYTFQTMPLATQSKAAFNEADISDKPVPLQKPLMTSADVTNLTRQYRDSVAAMLAVDDLVGAIVRALGTQLANTILVFTSDNGNLYGEHRLGGKEVAYEESIRVPLFVSGPGVVAGQSVDAIVLNNDLAPTIAELAGAVPGLAVDGRSFVPLLQGTATSNSRRRFLVEHLCTYIGNDYPTYAGIRTGPADVYPSRLYVEYFGNLFSPTTVTDRELYDLTVDPDELTNVQADPTRATERAALHAQLVALQTCGPTATSCQSAEQ